jgi:hypothetical protein
MPIPADTAGLTTLRYTKTRRMTFPLLFLWVVLSADRLDSGPAQSLAIVGRDLKRRETEDGTTSEAH